MKILNPESGSKAFRITEADKNDPSLFSAITIDEIINISNFEKVDILKIDIEGLAEKEFFSKIIIVGKNKMF